MEKSWTPHKSPWKRCTYQLKRLGSHWGNAWKTTKTIEQSVVLSSMQNAAETLKQFHISWKKKTHRQKHNENVIESCCILARKLEHISKKTSIQIGKAWYNLGIYWFNFTCDHIIWKLAMMEVGNLPASYRSTMSLKRDEKNEALNPEWVVFFALFFGEHDNLEPRLHKCLTSRFSCLCKFGGTQWKF